MVSNELMVFVKVVYNGSVVFVKVVSNRMIFIEVLNGAGLFAMLVLGSSVM